MSRRKTCCCLKAKEDDTESHGARVSANVSLPNKDIVVDVDKANLRHYRMISNQMTPGKSYNANTKEWTFTIWVPDCPRSRLDFIKSNKIPIELVHDQAEFLNYCSNRNFLISSKDYDKYKDLSTFPDDNLLQDLMSGYNAAMKTSEQFWSEKHKRWMCAYSLKGSDVNKLHIALKLFTEFWREELNKNSDATINRQNKVDVWLASTVSLDRVHTLGGSFISHSYKHQL